LVDAHDLSVVRVALLVVRDGDGWQCGEHGDGHHHQEHRQKSIQHGQHSYVEKSERAAKRRAPCPPSCAIYSPSCPTSRYARGCERTVPASAIRNPRSQRVEQTTCRRGHPESVVLVKSPNSRPPCRESPEGAAGRWSAHTEV